MKLILENWQKYLKEDNTEEGNVYSVDFPGLAKEKEEIESVESLVLDSELKKMTAKLFFNKHYSKDEETFNMATETLKKLHKVWRIQNNEEALNFLTSLTLAHEEFMENQNMYRLFTQQLEDEGLLE
jgi:hypothetical protein